MADDLLQFDCPRCSAKVSERLYGPCPQCREQLKVTMVGAGNAADVGEYEPKMNVTPNAVASKE